MSYLIVGSFLYNKIWYLLPLIVSVSLVYGATRHELMRPILHHAFRSATWILGFMAVIFVVLFIFTLSV